MNDNLTMTYSAIVTDKNQKKIVRIQFERKDSGRTDVAEGVLPDCKIASQKGFTSEEIQQLESFFEANREDIMGKAKVISNPLKWL